jgi:hypothetical protein
VASTHPAPAPLPGPLLAATLAVALTGLWPPRVLCAPPNEEVQREIVVTASRLSDEALVDAVTAALQQDPYILSGHVSVTVAHGVVTIRGQVREVTNLFAILRLARRIAGDSRVVDQIEFDPYDEDGN